MTDEGLERYKAEAAIFERMSTESNLDLWQHGGPPEPSSLMHVTAEIWPLAADQQGIWLVSGDWPWLTLPFADDTSFNAEFECALLEHGATAVLGPHGTSCRIDGPSLICSAVAVLNEIGPVRASWPNAKPIPVERIVAEVGKPPTHPANRVPDKVRQWDALVGTLRHLAFQLTPYGDAELAGKLNKWWRLYLADAAPILFRLYDRVHESA